MRSPSPSASVRFGGACTCIAPPSTRRASAMAWSRSSGGQGGASCIFVPGLGRKFWTITSCTCPWRSCDAPNREQRVEPLLGRLAEADEDAGRERDAGAAGGFERGEAAGRGLVGRAVVRAAGLVEPVGERLQHHPLRRADGPEPLELGLAECPGVGVGEQSGLLEHRPARRLEVVDRRRVAVGGEPLRGDRVAVLRPLAEGEQRLVAPERGAGPGDRQHLVDRQVRVVEARGRLGERAVAAPVPAQHRERDEDLRRVGDPVAVVLVPEPARGGDELVQGRVQQLPRVVGGDHGPQPMRRSYR